MISYEDKAIVLLIASIRFKWIRNESKGKDPIYPVSFFIYKDFPASVKRES